MKFYVYEWFIKETNKVFYVGKGTKNRYKVKKHNKLFNYILENNNCESRIIKEFDNENDAFEYEYVRIKTLWNNGECQANIYNGGTGGTVEWWTPEMRKKYSIYNVMKSEKQRERMSINNPMKNEITKNKVIKKTSKPIIIGDKKYDSIKDAAKQYNINDTSIQYWLKRGYSRDLKKCYYVGEEEPKEIILKDYSVNKKPIKIDEVYFSSVKDGAKYLGIDASILIKCLKNKKPYKSHICKYVNQQPSHMNFGNSNMEGSTTNE